MERCLLVVVLLLRPRISNRERLAFRLPPNFGASATNVCLPQAHAPDSAHSIIQGKRSPSFHCVTPHSARLAAFVPPSLARCSSLALPHLLHFRLLRAILVNNGEHSACPPLGAGHLDLHLRLLRSDCRGGWQGTQDHQQGLLRHPAWRRGPWTCCPWSLRQDRSQGESLRFMMCIAPFRANHCFSRRLLRTSVPLLPARRASATRAPTSTVSSSSS